MGGVIEQPKPAFKQYTRAGVTEMREYVPGEDMTGISVSDADKQLETLDGGYIARNSDNHADQWYVAKEYFNKMKFTQVKP